MTSNSAQRRCLIAVASSVEAGAVIAGFGAATSPPAPWSVCGLSNRVDLLLTGVGKANAAGASARALARETYERVINLGVGGALPGDRPAQIGQAVLASRCVFADEGIVTHDRWIALAEAGFPSGIVGDSVIPTGSVNAALLHCVDHTGTIATVSECSGTDQRAAEIARRCGPDALVEAMEGAAIGLAAARLGVAFAEIRIISNRTGDRGTQGWDMARALSRLETLARAVAGG